VTTQAQAGEARDVGDAPSRRLVAVTFVTLYVPLLLLAIAAISFSGGDDTRKYVEQTAKRPPVPPPPLPVLRVVEWPDAVKLERNPFAPAAIGASGTATPRSAATPQDIHGVRLVASYRDTLRPYAIGIRADGAITRLGVGDEIDGAVIEAIEERNLVLTSRGQQQVVPIPSR